MTLKEHQQIARAKYATACTQAKALGKTKPDWEQWKEQCNYYGTVTNIYECRPVQPEKATPKSTTQLIKDNTRRQEKALKQINITLRNVTQQADILDDFFQELSERYPEYKTYHKLSDYIFSSILDIQEKLQTL